MHTVLESARIWIKNILDRIVRKAKKITVPFFDRLPLYDVARFFWKGIVDGAITTRASSIAFNFILAVFPAIIFLFTLIPYIPINNFQAQLMGLIQSVLPDNAYVAIQGTIQDIITQPRGNLLSFGFFAAFIFSTNSLVSIIVAFNNTIHAIETRSIVNLYLIAFGLSLILTTLTTLSVALITLSNWAMTFLVAKHFIRFDYIYYLVIGGKWLVILLLFFFTFAFLFYFAPAKKMKFRFISAGGTLATILSILISVGFSFYINNFGKYNTLYGSIGTLIVVMLWFYFMALILLIGFELNVSIWSAQSKANTDASQAFIDENSIFNTEK
ncbi:MAG: YihY/virulence factor BrkB family protein [Prolixibacteraceae bacterium]|nr:YihY/virulence factor BrkB family protein [Prolixibacteraceae bacterium]